jgi:hypothetical protein
MFVSYCVYILNAAKSTKVRFGVLPSCPCLCSPLAQATCDWFWVLAYMMPFHKVSHKKWPCRQLLQMKNTQFKKLFSTNCLPQKVTLSPIDKVTQELFFKFASSLVWEGSWDSAVGIATGYDGLGGRRVRVQVPIGARLFSPRHPDWYVTLYIHPPICLHGVVLD